MTRLNDRQQRFVEAYAGEARGNATKAARIAGYAHADVQGPRLLGNVRVAHALLEAAEQRQSVAILDAKRRQALLSAFAEDEGAEVRDRIRAIEVLGRMQGDFVERREVEHRGPTVHFVFEDNGRGPRPPELPAAASLDAPALDAPIVRMVLPSNGRIPRPIPG